MGIAVKFRAKIQTFFAVFVFSLPSFAVELNSTAEKPGSSLSSVLLIGDSHTEGTFGVTLDQTLRDSPVYARVNTYGVGGSIPQWYLDGTQGPWGYFHRDELGRTHRSQRVHTPLIRRLLELHQPRTVVVALGTNFLWQDQRPEFEDELVRSIRETVQTIRVSRARCIWVGPPRLGGNYTNRIENINQKIQQTLRELPENFSCSFVSSQFLPPFPVKTQENVQWDGIHYDRAGTQGVAIARAWATEVANQIARTTSRR